MTKQVRAYGELMDEERAADVLAHNEPTAFDRLSPEMQHALRLWIRLALRPAKTPGPSSSYGLKHAAEEAMHWYTSNGELKGAMLAEGYTSMNSRREINWTFGYRQRCPHRFGVFGRYPELCQATPAELAEFDQAVLAMKEADRKRRAALTAAAN